MWRGQTSRQEYQNPDAPRRRERHNGRLRRPSSAAQNGQESFVREEGAKGSGLPETRSYVSCFDDLYQGSRTHLSLEKDAPETRPVQAPELGSVIELLRSAGSITTTNGGRLEGSFSG